MVFHQNLKINELIYQHPPLIFVDRYIILVKIGIIGSSD